MTGMASPYSRLMQQGVIAKNPPDLIIVNRAPVSSDFDFTVGTIWVYTNTAGYLLVSRVANVATWKLITFAITPAVNFIVDSGTSPVQATSSGDLSLLGGPGVTTVGSTNTITINIDAESVVSALIPDSGTSPVVPNGSGQIAISGSGSITTVGGTNALTVQLTGLTNNSVLVGAGTSTISKIGPSIDGVFISDHTGVPSWLANGTPGYVLTANSAAPPSWQVNAGGDVSGPGSSTDRAIATWNGTAGNSLFNNSTVTIDSSQNLRIGSAIPADAKDFNIERTTSGGQVGMQIRNLSNTANSYATLGLVVAGSTAADAYIGMNVNGVSNWILGVDNSDSDSFKISPSTDVGTNNALAITTTGAVNVSLGNLTVSRSVVGSVVSMAVVNTDNTNSASSSIVNIQTGGSSAGDPYIISGYGASHNWSFGQDTSDSECFCLSRDSTLGDLNTTLMRGDPTGTKAQLSVGFGAGSVSVPSNFLVPLLAATYSDTKYVGLVISNIHGTAATDSKTGIAFSSANDANGYATILCSPDDFNEHSASIAIQAKKSDVLTTMVNIAGSGNVTAPLQSSFFAQLTTSPTNVTGDGTTYTLICDLEIYDRNSNYNNSTGVFTAPVTGIYYLSMWATITGIGVAHTSGSYNISVSGTSANVFNGEALNWAVVAIPLAGNIARASCSVTALMTAGDTATFTVTISNGTKVVGLIGSAAGSCLTYVMGYLLG